MQPTGRHLAPPFLPPQAPPPLNAKLICPRRKHISICSTSVFLCIVIQYLPLSYINMYTRKGYAVQRSSLFYSFSTSFCPWYTFMVFHPFHCFQSYLFLQIFLPCSWTKVICDPVKCPITDSTLPRSTLHFWDLAAESGDRYSEVLENLTGQKSLLGKLSAGEKSSKTSRTGDPSSFLNFCQSMINQEVVYEINALLPSDQKY